MMDKSQAGRSRQFGESSRFQVPRSLAELQDHALELRGMHWVAAAGVFSVSCVLHLQTYGFINDQFDRISRGRQIVQYNELPFRDFFDPGYFLTLFTSAAVQVLFGDNLLGEALLNVGCF